MATLAGIVDNGLCLGCGGCVAALGRPDLTMAMTADGFLRPDTPDLTAAEQTVLETVCPGLSLTGTAGEGGYHPLWGPIRSLDTGFATDPDVRFGGSSGGVLTALAQGLVASGEVEFVLTNSADPDDPINNATKPASSRADLMASAGSRYAPSAPLAAIMPHLDAGARFAFVGKPCDVAGLAMLARHDPRIDAQIPYRLAFFCAGVPSRNGTLAVLDKLGVDHDDCASFRYRGDGWPGLARAQRHDGSAATMDYNSSWGTILNRHLQFRCKICPDGTGESADVACADAWVSKDGYPDFAERDGRSLIVARTAVGEALIQRARAEGWIATEPLAVSEIERMQPYQASRKRNTLARVAGLLLARGVVPRYGRLALVRLALGETKMMQARNAWGTFRRSRGRKLV